MSHSTPGVPGRRSADRRRRPDLTSILAVVLPVLCALALLLVDQDVETASTHPPARTALTKATLVCPSPIAGSSDDVSLTSAARDVDGTVTVGLGERQTDADIASGKVTTVAGGRGPAAVTAEDETAPGLVAARFGGPRVAAASCPSPAPRQWFTGVGAGAGHTSVLELVNPDSGTAVADVTVYGRGGVVDVPRLRGVSVRGGTSVRLDLGSVVPRRDELAVEVVASRGRVGASVLDRLDPVGSGEPTEDWLPAQLEPTSTNLLLGLAPGSGARTLVLANGGNSEVRADLRLVADESAFAPRDVPEIRVAPQSVERVSLTAVLGRAAADDATGLEVTSTGPLTATLRSSAGGDLSHAVGGEPLRSSATALLPDVGQSGAKQLVLAGPRSAGVAEVVARSAGGKELDSTRVELVPGRGATVDLPDRAASVTVSPSQTSVTAAVLVTAGTRGSSAAVVPLTEPLTSGLVPAVRPGLP